MMPRLYRHAWMDDDIDAFREQVRRFVGAQLAPQLEGWRRQGYIPRETWRTLGALGFILPELPERYGGSSTSAAWQLVLQDELARAEVPANLAVHCIAAHYILDYGTEEQKSHWLPRLASGEDLAAIAMTEPGAGSDLKAMAMRARRDGEDYVLDGTKTFITNGFTASVVVTACRTGGAGAGGISLLIVPTKELPGFSASRFEKIGQHASDTAELAFDGVRVPAANLLGKEGAGFGQLMSQLAFERMLLAVPAAAAIDRALELTLAHTRERKMFGGTLFDLQNTRFRLAEVATSAHVVRSFVNDCTQRLVDGTLDPEAAYMAKLWCTEQQGKVMDECLQLFGGYGYMTEYPIARLYADARVQRIYGGANEVMKELISRAL
jgi:acyl-CoA dehydrogenase